MILTQSNYHSKEASERWLSASAIKRARRCEAEFLYGEPDEEKDAFIAGHLLELLVTDDLEGLEAFEAEHPQMFSSRGPTKGRLKASYLDVLECAERIKAQPFLMQIIYRSRKQVIMTGKVFGMPVRMMCDLLDVDDSIFDLKSTRSFARVWSDEADSYVEWWQEYYYPMQLWLYREIARQNGLKTKKTGLIGASKSNFDVQALQLSEDTLAQARSDVAYTIGRIKAIRTGAPPMRCERCAYCIGTKLIKGFELV